MNIKIKKGFTMIELLVVISIIGILAALALVSFTSSQKQARDAARKSDLRQYSAAFENFANSNGGLYKSRNDVNGVSAATYVCADTGITTCPEDPKHASDSTYPVYTYNTNGTGSASLTATKYVLWAKLESSTDYWVVCSDGKVGKKAVSGWAVPSAGTCPL